MKKAILVTIGYNFLTILSLALTFFLERSFSSLIWFLTLLFIPLSLILVYYFFKKANDSINILPTEVVAKKINFLPYKSTFFLYLLHFIIFVVGVIIDKARPMEIAEAFQLAMLMGAYLFFGFEAATFDLKTKLNNYKIPQPFPKMVWKILVTFFVFSLFPMLFIVVKNYYLSLEPNFSLDQLFHSTIITLIRTVVISMIAGAILAYTIIKPIRELANEMRFIKAGDYSRFSPVYSTDETGVLSSGFNEMVQGLREREKIKSTFQKYLSADAADAILDGQDKLGGHLVEVTLLFSDIRNFTTLSEKYQPDKVVENLNRYFTGIVKAIESHGGIVNKFIGDAVFAIFGLSIKQEMNVSHADQALAASFAMMRALNVYNLDNQKMNLPEIKIGIGIHSGPVILGNIGSETRMEYTVIGDSVNTASRIESATKDLAAPILLSEATKNLLTIDVPMEKSFRVRLKGKKEIVRVFAPNIEKRTEDQILSLIKDAATTTAQIPAKMITAGLKMPSLVQKFWKK